MANRHWVGGSGSYTDTAHWSTSSGGSGGASVPTTGDIAIFDQESGSAIEIRIAVLCHIEITALGWIDFAIYTGGSLSLKEDLLGLRNLIVSGGTFTTNNYDVSVVRQCWMYGNSVVNLGTSVLYLGIDTPALAGVSDLFISVMYYGGSIDADQATIVLRKFEILRFEDPDGDMVFGEIQIISFSGYAAVLFAGGGIHNINNFFIDAGDAEVIIGAQLPEGETPEPTVLNVTNLVLNGETTGGLDLHGKDDLTWTINKTSGAAIAKNCTITDCEATGGADYIAQPAEGNIDGGNNSGWLFKNIINVSPGALSVTLSTVTRGYNCQVESGAVSISGSSAGFNFSYRMVVASGSIAITKKSVALDYSGGNVGTTFIELSPYNGAPIADSFDTFEDWIPGAGGGSPAATGYDIGIGVGIFDAHGTNAGLRATRILDAASKALEISGTAVDLAKDCPLPATSGSVELSGTAVDLSATRKMAAASKALAISGSALVLLKSFPLAVASGSAAISGTAVSLVVTRKIEAATGAIVETGQAVSLARTALMAAASGSIAITGTDVSLTTDRRLSVASDAFVVTGTPVIFNGERHFAVSSGAFTHTGQSVGLSIARKVAAATKAFTLSGQPISLLGGRKINAEAGSLSETGDGIDLLTDRRIAALFGAEIISGTDAGLKRFAKLLVDSGALTFTGTDVEISTLGIRPQAGHFLINGSNVSFLKARGVWVQTVFSHAAGRNTVSAEKVRRATAQPRITGV